jgi:16S rRNA (cytosine967-C5)-methyltransferase
VEDFLAHHKSFKLYDLAPLLGDLFPKVTRDGMLRLFPHVHQTDGFFGAVLVREKA